MNMTGKVLGGRYAVGERLGGGGTAFVYRGRDALLNRTVAIKVLNTQMTVDGDFVAKFRREAQAAASLSNPHIVAIYDVGQDQDTHFIVMEYVEGKTLKELIVDSGTVESKVAIDIAMQIAEALRHAHQHNVIHRDIKPLNILMTRDGQAKVTDFGIARATTSSTLTQSGALMGSVHYLSPEQARGGFTNERSDIYSLGVVMYEMLAGDLPFTGDNVFSIGLKHLQESPRPLSELCPTIDPRLEAVVMKCLRKEQDNRYQTAQALFDALSLLAGNGVTQREAAVTPGRDSRRSGVEKQKRKVSWLAVVSSVMAVTMLLTVAGLLYTFWPRPEVVVPEIVGKTLAEATADLREVGLNYTIKEAESNPDVAPNVVLRQNPEGGQTVRAGRTVEIVPSRGPELLEVPNVIGMTLLQAEISLTREGFVLGQKTERTHETVPAEHIIEQNPRPGTLTQRGEHIDVLISLGVPVVEVLTPLLVGLTEAEVVTRLSEVGLSVRTPVTQEFHATVPYGRVISQTPQAGERLPLGGEVSIVVSRGQQAATVVVISADRLAENTRIEVSVDDREGMRVVYDRVHKRQDGEIRVPVSGIAPFRLIVRIDGRIDRDEIIGQGGT
ncbi:MAG: Serine/threonine-protein kinase PrkC [Firmicutes bacterium]|nr:Serine/threonine-protein kinase PrkC [candidate division NPL-UPA2 bacterium]